MEERTHSAFPVFFIGILIMIAGAFSLHFNVFDNANAAVADTGTYSLEVFNNTSLSGSPVLSDTTQGVHSSAIPSSAKSSSFSARWTGQISTPQKATYQFIVESQDGVRIWVDNKEVLSRWSEQIRWEAFIVDMSAGDHTIKVQYYQQGSDGRINLSVKSLGRIARHPTGGTVTPPPPPPTPPPPPPGGGDTAVVFVTGGNMTQSQTAALQTQITNYYRARLPAGTPWLIVSYDSNIVSAVRSRYPNQPVVLIGHSFGGNAVVNAAASLASTNPIKLMMLFDPVHINSPDRAENFTIPSSVQKAVAYRRQYVDGVPASGLIANPRSQDRNTIYPMDASRRYDSNYIAEMHGWAVWQESVFPIISPAL